MGVKPPGKFQIGCVFLLGLAYIYRDAIQRMFRGIFGILLVVGLVLGIGKAFSVCITSKTSEVKNIETSVPIAPANNCPECAELGEK